MNRTRHFALLALGIGLAAAHTDNQAQAAPCAAGFLTGSAALLSDWSDDRPGLCRLLRPADIGPTGRSTTSYSTIIPAPPNVLPKVPPGFKVSRFHVGADQPRLIRTAPNGDIFVAESRAGQIRVLRPAGSCRARQERVVRFRARPSVRHRVLPARTLPDPYLCRREQPGGPLPLRRRRSRCQRDSGSDRALLCPRVPAICPAGGIGPATSPSRLTARRCTSRSARTPTCRRTARTRRTGRRSWSSVRTEAIARCSPVACATRSRSPSRR